MERWLQTIINGTPPPADEDVFIVRAVMKRVLEEFELEKNGCLLKKQTLHALFQKSPCGDLCMVHLERARAD